MEGQVFEQFQKIQKTFEIPKTPKLEPKSSQPCFEHVLEWFFRKFFLSSVPWRVETSKMLEKNPTVQNFYKYSLSAM